MRKRVLSLFIILLGLLTVQVFPYSTEETKNALKYFHHIPAASETTNEQKIGLLLNKIENSYFAKDANLLFGSYSKDFRGPKDEDFNGIVTDTGIFFKSTAGDIVLNFASFEAHFQADKATMEAYYSISYSKDPKRAKNYMISSSVDFRLIKANDNWQIVGANKTRLWE